MVSFGGSKSSTTSGYYDPNTQEQRDWWADKTMGQGGLYDQYANGSNVFSGDGSYDGTDFTSGGFDPTNFGKSSYSATTFNPYEFTAPTLSYTELDDKQYQNQADLISKNVDQSAKRIIQQEQDNAAYQGRGGGDLADYRAASTLRDAAAAQADALKGLASDRMATEFADRQNVNKFISEGDMWKQGAQAENNLSTSQATDASKQAAETAALERKKATEASKQFGAQDALSRLQAGESSKQYGNTSQMQYLTSKLQELSGNKQSLNDLLSLMAGFSEAGQKKPTSKSGSMSVGVG